jgi:YidC/Oxa1 family membrane protein insertase
MTTLMLVLLFITTIIIMTFVQGLPGEHKYLRIGTIAFCAFVTTLGFQAWLGGDTRQMVQAGESYRVLPSEDDMNAPLVTTFEYGAAQEREAVVVENELYNLSFSSHGGVISDISYPRYPNDKGEALVTVSDQHGPQEHGLFVLTLDDTAPLAYRHDKTSQKEQGTEVSFSASTSLYHITKTYFVHSDVYQIDLGISVTPRSSEAAQRIRLLLPSPDITSLTRDRSQGLYLKDKASSVSLVSDSQVDDQAWAIPELFGVDNTYTVHALVKDTNTFVRRGYFKKLDDNNLAAVLEGPIVRDEARYNLSFFVGPKTIKAISAVDARLESTLGFGWLAPISKLLMRLLQELYRHLHNYGFAILLLVMLLTLLLLPFKLKANKAIRIQERLAPRLAMIRKQYGHDQLAMNTEIMKLYKEHNISMLSPILSLGVMIVQMVMFFSFQRVVNNCIDLYHAPFAFWVTDLSAKDPYSVIPLILIALMLINVAVSNQSKKPGFWIYGIILLFGSLFFSFPVGLLLVIAGNSIAMILDQKLGRFLHAS